MNLFTNRSRQTPEYMASLPPPEAWYDKLVRSRNMVITGPSRFKDRYVNSVIIGFGSTFLAVFLGTPTAYAFSRFRVPLQDDLLFFILSTRMRSSSLPCGRRSRPTQRRTGHGDIT